MQELIDALRNCGNYNGVLGTCPKCDYVMIPDCRMELMRRASDAIERLTDEVDRKDKAIQGLLTQIERKDKTIERMRDLMKHYKAAYRAAYKLYQEARNDKLS